jgi:hypothetical protein
MHLTLDDDVKLVAEFMQSNIPAARLVGVAAGILQLSNILWGHYPMEDCRPLRLLADDPHKQQDAIKSCLAL